MSRSSSVAFSAVIVALLVMSVLAEVWWAPAAVQSVITSFPETAPLRVPSVVWVVVASACCQIVGVVAIRAALTAAGPGRDAAVRVARRAVIVCALVLAGLAVVGLVALGVLGYSTPGATLGLVVVGLVGLVGAGAVGLRAITGT